jgi:hypothetical protein
MLLSDGYLSLPVSCKNARLQLAQFDKEFIEHLYDKLKVLVRTGPKETIQYLKETNKTYTCYKFSTLVYPYFTEIYPHWYSKVNSKNIKKLPYNISELLTLRAIAYWIMGDGTYDKQNKAIKISTESFSETEVKTLQEILLSKYNIRSNKYYSNKSKNLEQYIIYIPRKDSINLSVLVYPYFTNNMLYKLGL